MKFFSGKLNKSEQITKGDLLLAEPLLDDPNFERSVVLVCEHNENGTFGLIINKPSTLTIEAANDVFLEENQLYVGGPVEQNTLHFVHTLPQIEACVPIKDGFYLGGDFEQLKEFYLQGLADSRHFRLVIGYSGWEYLQLDAEVTQNAWIIARCDLHDIFKVAPEKLWAHILKGMGGRYKTFLNYPLDPRLN